MSVSIAKARRQRGGKESRGEQRVESREQRAESREQRAESREQRAESREQRGESREQRAESREQRAESREQSRGLPQCHVCFNSEGEEAAVRLHLFA
jgi:hypothetical protein